MTTEKFFRPEITPLVTCLLQNPMIKQEITMTEQGLERKDIPINFNDLCILREAYDHAKKDELPVLVIAPLSLRAKISRGNFNDWRVSYPVERGDAIMTWKTQADRFVDVLLQYSMFGKPPFIVRHPKVGSLDDTNAKRFGVIFAECEMVTEKNGRPVPHQVLVFG